MKALASLKTGLFAAVAAGSLLLTAGAASAATFVYDLNVDTCTGTCGGLPSYGTVSVDGMGTTTLTFDVELAPNVYFNQAGHPEELFSLVGSPAISISGIAPAGKFGALGAQTAGSHSGGGSLGNFGYLISYIGSPSNNGNLPAAGLQSLKFTVTSASNLTLASGIKATPVPHATHIYFVADVYGSNGNTGRIGATFSHIDGGNEVPEPAAWALMILGFGAIGSDLRRRRALATA